MIWRGSSSQKKNIGLFFMCLLFCWLVIPVIVAFTRFFQTKCHVFELTTERLKMTEGVFNKVTDTLELYRVKDIEVRQPFFYRFLGLENLVISTSDISSPIVHLDAIPKAVRLPDKIRNQVETIRMAKNV